MKVSNRIPEIYEKCRNQFGVDWERGVIITYGDTVYCKHSLPEHKIAHEYAHVIQQLNMGTEIWWKKYLTDKEFRLSQEVEAYQAEADYITKNIKDRNQRFNLLRQIYLDLSSSMYGNICSYSEAKKLIKI